LLGGYLVETILGNAYDANCPTRKVLDWIGDKWTVLIIGILASGTMRFSKLRGCIGGISQKMLAQTLRNLERDGLVTRTVYPEVPPRVEYTLTPLGETLVPHIVALRVWAEEHIGEVTAAQARYEAREAATEVVGTKVG
jgi:DNA-binding HxlR family transcriptional regulator